MNSLHAVCPLTSVCVCVLCGWFSYLILLETLGRCHQGCLLGDRFCSGQLKR